MLDTLLSIAFGIGFVYFGRWMYANPQKVYPSWVLSRPDNPAYPRFVRVFATVVIFGGAYITLIRIAGSVFPDSGFALLLAVLAAFLVAWYFRPKHPVNQQ